MKGKIGYFLSHEQFSPADLVEYAVAAEQAAFDSVWASDHFHPWQDNQGHAGAAWLTLAAVGARTSRVQLGTAVTCPIYRNRPALVAQAFATLAVLYPDRVFLGVGTGEAVNEVPAGGGWDPYRKRLALLRESVELIRRLWRDGYVTHHGPGFPIANAKVYDKPKTPVPIYIAAGGPKSAALAGEIGDGWVANSTVFLNKPEVDRAFRKAAADRGADDLEVLVELYVFVGKRDEALASAPLWAFAPVEYMVRDVADPREVQRIAEEHASLEDVVASWLISVDADEHIAQIERLFESGATHVAIHSVQPDQRRLIEFYEHDVLPRLRGARE